MTVSGTVPQDSDQQFFGTEYSSICSTFARPIILTGLFRDILTRHFASAAYIESPDLKHLVWQRTIKDSKILVESIHRWDPRTTQRRPAVIIKRGAFTNRRRGLGGERRQLNPSDLRGNPHYSTFWVGSHTLFCIGGSGPQAELLATEVQRELHQFSQLIADEGLLHRCGVVEVGEMAELEEWSENFVVPVTVGYSFEESWTIRAQAPTLKRIALSAILEC